MSSDLRQSAVKTEEPQDFCKNQGLLMGSKIIGRSAIFYQDAPPPPKLQVLLAVEVDQSKTSGAGASSQADSQGQP